MENIARRVLGIAGALTFLTACSSTGTGTPAAASAAQPSAVRPAAGKGYNVSGQYAGKFVDIAYGTGKATASYAQYQTAVGGNLTIKYSNSTVNAAVVQTASGSTVDGTTVASSGSLYCTFSTTGTFDAVTHVLSGSYKAVRGCAGESGTFSLKQKCYYRGANGDAIRPENGPRPC